MQLFNDIFPIVALASIGYLVARFRLISSADTDSLASFTFNLVIPCLLFLNIANAEVPANFGLDLLLAYYGAVLLAFVIAALLAARLFGYGPASRSAFAMGATYSNTTIVGIPLVLQTLGEAALLPLFILIALQNLFLFVVATISAEMRRGAGASVMHQLRQLLWQLVSSPLTGSLLLGLAFNLLDLPLHMAVENSVALVAQAAIPMALLVLGASLNQYTLRGEMPAAITLSLLKTVLLPLLVYLSCFRLFDLEPLWAATALLASTLPSGVSAYVFATRYRASQGTVAAGTLISTLFSLVPVILVLYYLYRFVL